jgi:hypothetical protein
MAAPPDTSIKNLSGTWVLVSLNFNVPKVLIQGNVILIYVL